MHASTHTLELGPAVTSRLVAVRKSAPARRETPVSTGSVDIACAPELATAVATPVWAPLTWSWPSLGDAMEFGCFTATLAGISVLQFGAFALLL